MKLTKILFLGFFLRLLGIYIFKNISNYDLQSYLKIGEMTLKGINIYPSPADIHHPYFPFFLYIEALAFSIAKSNIIVIIIIKIIIIIFDSANIYLIHLLSKKNLKTALLYAVNPISILIFALHGQFDSLPLFFVLLSIYLLKQKKQLFSALFYSLAIAAKTWPLLFFFLIYKLLKNKKLIFTLLVLPAISVIIYSVFFKSPVLNILNTLVNYQGLWGIWGLWSLISINKIFIQKFFTFLFLFCFFTHSFYKTTKNLISSFFYFLTFFFVFTTNFSIQYLSWYAPFLILVKPKSWKMLVILITLYLMSFYFFLIYYPGQSVTPSYLKLIQNILGFIVWLSLVRTWYIFKKTA